MLKVYGIKGTPAPFVGIMSSQANAGAHFTTSDGRAWGTQWIDGKGTQAVDADGNIWTLLVCVGDPSVQAWALVQKDRKNMEPVRRFVVEEE